MAGDPGDQGPLASGPPPIVAWTGAELVFEGGVLVIDLQGAAGAALPRRLAELGLAGPFAVITPCNPRGRVMSPQENDRRVAAAAAALARRELATVPVVGQSPDRSHREAGWAVAFPRAEAVALAREWEQEGLYWWDGSRFWIVSVAGDWPDIALPVRE